MLLSYRNDVTPAKSAGVGFRSHARSIAVTLTYLSINKKKYGKNEKAKEGHEGRKKASG